MSISSLFKRARRGAAALLALATLAAVLFTAAKPAYATSGDVFARDVGYCASTYNYHSTIPGFGPSVDINIGLGDDIGTPLHAPEAGSVSAYTRDGQGDAGWGNSIIWRSASGAERLHLAHLRGDTPMTDRNVNAGDLIGYLGNTGTSSTGAHLHIARSVNGAGEPLQLSGRTVNPPVNTATNCTDGPYYFVSIGPAGPAPGGWYIAPSPSDGQLISGPLKLGVQAKDNGNGGLKRVDITVFDPVEQRWKVAGGQSFGAGVSEKQVFAEYPTVWDKVYLFSFDVYSQNGRFQLAPSGVRQACTGSVCFPYGGGSGGGGGGSGGAGCLPNPQVNASVSALGGDDGWVRSNATVTLSGFDANGCGQSVSVEYSLDGGPWTTSSSPVAVNGDGVHRLRHRARSGGVTGAERELEVKIDTVPPVIGEPTISAPIDMNNIIRDRADITIPWIDATSGVRWVKHKCGTDDYTQTAGGTAAFALAGAGVTSCDSYARDVAGWEAAPWNSGPLIFNMLVMDASGTLNVDSNTGTSVTGQARGGNFRAVYNTGTSISPAVWLTGTGPVTVSGNVNSSFATTPAPTPVPRLNYPFPFYQGRSLVMNGPLYIDNVNTPLPPYCIYVKGDIIIRAVKLDTKACLIAERDILDDSTATTWVSGDPANGMLMMAGRDIRVRSTGNSNLGLIYAPDGAINFDGTTGLDSKGSAVAKDIHISGVTNTTFSYAPGFAATIRPLPLGSPFIPAPPTAPAPGTPTMGLPANGATGVGTATCFTWSGTAKAYEVQVAKAATFDAAGMVLSESSLQSTLCTRSLPGSTKLYWRVRAVGIGGAASPWTATASFTTKAADPTLTINDVTTAEGNSGTKTAQLTITRSGSTSGTSSVSVATYNGSATAPADYAARSTTTVSFAAGQTSAVFSVTINGDTAVENDEYLEVRLASPTGATIADGVGRLTITNDDVASSPPTLAVNDVTVTEGDVGTQMAQFTVTRSGPTAGTSTVQYRTRDGSADPGDDYVDVPLTNLTFSPGETSKAVFVTVIGDTEIEEGGETFTLELSSPVGATISDGSGTATVRDNDAELSIEDVGVEEGDGGAVLADFTITRTGATGAYSWVVWATANGTAVAPADYQAVSPTMLGFAPGETVKTVAVAVNGDTLDEPDETFNVVLSSPSGAAIAEGAGTGTANIDDDD